MLIMYHYMHIYPIFAVLLPIFDGKYSGSNMHIYKMQDRVRKLDNIHRCGTKNDVTYVTSCYTPVSLKIDNWVPNKISFASRFSLVSTDLMTFVF